MKIWVKLGLLVLMIAVICANLLHASQPEAQHSNTTWPQVPTTSQDVTQPSPTDAVTQPTTQPPTEAPTDPPTEPPTQPPTEPPTEPPTQPSEPPATDPPSSPLTASHAFIYDCEDRSLRFLQGSMEDTIHPASITKMFTAYVALQYLNPDDMVTVGSIIKTVPDNSSFAWVHVGDEMTVEQLLAGMLLPSGGDAARAMAAIAGRVIAQDPQMSESDAYAAFLSHMNAMIAELGMTGTYFSNADGYPTSNHYSCMADILQMSLLCMENPTIRQIMGSATYSVTLSDRTLSWKNTNQLLHPDSKFYRDTAIGMKTGYTPQAGRCLVSVFCIDGEYTVMGVFGCPESKQMYIAQFENSCYLYDTYIAP